MSYELLLKETAALSYEEQVNLMAYLANSIQASINQAKKELQQEIGPCATFGKNDRYK